MNAPLETKPDESEVPLKTQEEQESAGDTVKTVLIAILLALLIRTFAFEPFNIPSGSMFPTLKIGDYLFVSKTSYGYSRFSFPFGLAPIEGRVLATEPKRGDVVVFKLPANPSVDFIKRVIGLPGDTVQVKAGRLYINGVIVPREPVGLKRLEDSPTMVMEYIETLPGGAVHSIYEESDDALLDNTREFKVPADHYFMMGDNRDNSQDSRVEKPVPLVGYVPFANLVGRADILFFSTNGAAKFYEPWKWPWTIRYDRLLMNVNPARIETDDSAHDAAQ